jgi:hypothetical protein
MKENLIQFIQQIISSIDVEVNEFKVFSHEEVLPETLEDIYFESEYIVCVWLDNNIDAIVKEKFENFLRKQVNSSANILYWNEGLSLKKSRKKPIEDLNTSFSDEENKKIDFLKCSTILPTWLEQSIFVKHNAKYAPNHEKFDMNLNLTREELKVYLGTYFPRSYSESFCIFDNLFKNKKYKSLAKKETINILDVGSGTGGNLIGLLVSLNKYGLAIKEVNIVALDGNKEALEILSDLIEDFSITSTFKINLKTVSQHFTSLKDLYCSEDENFDFIMSSKLGCELIANGWTKFYHDLTIFCLPKLTSTGLFLMLDVTTKVASMFNPILMSEQINKAVKILGKYKSLIPISCGEFEFNCAGNCFTQRTFFVTHSHKRKDKSKVTYRVIGNTDFVNQFSMYNKEFQYINIFEQGNISLRCCQNSTGKIKIDNYKF